MMNTTLRSMLFRVLSSMAIAGSLTGVLINPSFGESGEGRPPTSELHPGNAISDWEAALAESVRSLTCREEFIVDGEGGGEGVTISNNVTLTVPQGTDYLVLHVYYFSREWPSFTGQQSIWNDYLVFTVENPYGTVVTGSTYVNALDALFQSGAYPGGTYEVETRTIDYRALTQSGSSWITLAATAVNVTDDAYGSGVAFVVEIGGVVGVTIINPLSSLWDDDYALKPKEVLFFGQPLKVKVKLSEPIQSLSDFTCPVEARVFNRTSDWGVQWVPISIDGTAELSSDGREIHITVPYVNLTALGLVPAQTHDQENEYCSADKNASANPTVGSNRLDSDAFDRLAKRTLLLRGIAREGGNLGANPPEFPFSADFLASAGVRLLEVRAGPKRSPVRQIQNQADWFYISSHGDHTNASISNDGGSVRLFPNQARWNQDLELVIFAGCSVLDINDYNNNYSGAAHNASPGLQWETTGPAVFLGYNWYAPLDNQAGNPNYTANLVMRFFSVYFEKYLRNRDVITAWRDANRNTPGLVVGRRSAWQRPFDACAIDLRPQGTANDTYWFFDYAVNPPNWRSVIRSSW